MRLNRILLAAALLAGGGGLAVTTSGSAFADTPAVETPAAPTLTLTSAVETVGTVWMVRVRGVVTGIPADTLINFSRTDAESPAGKLLGSMSFDSTGAFDFTDRPDAGGVITYTVATPPSDAFSAVAAQTRVTVPFQTAALSLTNNKSVFAYAEPVRFTATLGDTFTNHKVEIWADPAGADQGARLLGSGTVNGYHLYSVPFTMTRNTVVTVKFAGDTRFAPRSVTSTAGTKVATSTAITKHYKTAKIGSIAYQYVRKAKNPVFTTTMTYQPGRKQKLTFEYYSAGTWKAWKSGLFALNTAGKSTWTLAGTHKTGVRYRVRAGYLPGTSGDSLNTATYGAWKYFTFTS